MAELAPGVPRFDLPDLVGRMAALLHRSGIPVSPERSVAFVEVLHLIPPVDRTALYWGARLAFLTGRDQVATFDAVFDQLFAGLVDPAGARGDQNNPPVIAVRSRRPTPQPATSVAPPGVPAWGRPASLGGSERGPRSGRESQAIPTVASHEEVLGAKDFASMTDEEMAAAERLLAEFVVATPKHRIRRREPHGGRKIDVRRTLRLSYRTGGDPARLARSRPSERRRRLVLLCDISGSMEPYTRAYLHFCHRAAASGVQAEAFVFATRLTRLTTILRNAPARDALQSAGASAPDWSGGTRIGASLAEFNNRYGRRGLARGAVVVIFSDGWERDDPEVIGREMARLSLLAYRVVWVNPRKAAPGFSPRAGGMAAALPYCDAFVGGHTVSALAEVVQAVGGSVKSDIHRKRRIPK